jgi:hypothetical protein
MSPPLVVVFANRSPKRIRHGSSDQWWCASSTFHTSHVAIATIAQPISRSQSARG